MAYERSKAIQSKEDLIASLQAELNEKNKKLESIDSEWASAKGKLTKDATVKRLMQENQEFRGLKLLNSYKLLFLSKNSQLKQVIF